MIWRLAAESSAAVSLGVGACALTLAAAAVCLRPEAFAAGPTRVGWGLLAFLGTIAAATVPLISFLIAFLCAARLSRRGAAMALSTLGLGSWRVWRKLWPLWILLTMLSLLVASVVEPPAWRLVHQLKGSPQAAAVGWARLQAGEQRVLPGGGGLALRDGVLHLADGGGAWRGSALAPAPSASVGVAGWELGPARLLRSDGSLWQMQSLNLHLDRAQLARYRAPPRSPWASSSSALLTAACEKIDSAPCQRAALVLHRRLSWLVLVPVMALLGWTLGWSLARRGRARRGIGWLVTLPTLGLYCALKLGEVGLRHGLCSGMAAAWAPALVPLGLLVWALSKSEPSP